MYHSGTNFQRVCQQRKDEKVDVQKNGGSTAVVRENSKLRSPRALSNMCGLGVGIHLVLLAEEEDRALKN